MKGAALPPQVQTDIKAPQIIWDLYGGTPPQQVDIAQLLQVTQPGIATDPS